MAGKILVDCPPSVCHNVFVAKNIKHAKCQLIVNRFCGHIKSLPWGREIKIAQKLIKIEPEASFWLSLEHKKLSSLSWFLTEEGKLFLKTSKLKESLRLKENPSLKIEEEKIGEDKQIEQKPKTVLDFLKKKS
jgi:hypothetical protein